MSRRPKGKLDLDPVTVRKARSLARKAGKPIVELAKGHTTVSVERAESGVPLLGINLGHYGFLAEAEEEFIAGAIDAIACGHYAVEERMTIDAVARRNGALSRW